jgi:hypothetical protein
MDVVALERISLRCPHLGPERERMEEDHLHGS